MTLPSTAPEILKSLAFVLSRAPAWFGIFPGANDAAKQAAALAATYYPDASADDTLPLALLEMNGRDSRIIMFFDPDDQTVSDVQRIGDELTYQLQSRFRLDMTGVVIADEPTASDVEESPDWAAAGGDPAHTITISANLGINL